MNTITKPKKVRNTDKVINTISKAINKSMTKKYLKPFINDSNN